LNILVINSGENVDAGRWVADCMVDNDAVVTIIGRTELIGGSDARGFDRVFLSGSERSVFEEADWISAQLDFVRRCADRRVPMMGVCFGHQMVVRALYGKDALKRRESPEVGWRDVRFRDHWLFDGFSSPLPAFNFHFDEVIADRVSDFDVIAESDDCSVHAIVHKDLPLVGIQFHPEIKPEDGAREIRERAGVLARYGIDGEKLVAETPTERKTYLPRILLNFIGRGF
jgi:GMP synthase-like glutamine amidotransferase